LALLLLTVRLSVRMSYAPHLARQGFEEPGAFPAFGAALGFCIGRIHSELGFDLGAQTLRSRLTSAETSLEENNLRFDIGYAALNARRHALFPFLGVALVSHGVDPIRMLAQSAAEMSELYSNSARSILALVLIGWSWTKDFDLSAGELVTPSGSTEAFGSSKRTPILSRLKGPRIWIIRSQVLTASA